VNQLASVGIISFNDTSFGGVDFDDLPRWAAEAVKTNRIREASLENYRQNFNKRYICCCAVAHVASMWLLFDWP